MIRKATLAALAVSLTAFVGATGPGHHRRRPGRVHRTLGSSASLPWTAGSAALAR